MKQSHKAQFCFWLTAALLGSMHSASIAHACKRSVCAGANVVPASGEIPLDQLQFVFRAAEEQSADVDAGPTGPHLYRIDGNQRTELALQTVVNEQDHSYSLRPVAAVEPGTKLVLEAAAPTCAPNAALAAQFTVAAASAVPASLGTLEVSVKQQLLEVATLRGSCTERVDASYADLQVGLSDGAAPFRDVIDYRLILDGAPYRGFYSSPGSLADLGRGHARVFAPCDADTTMSLVSSVKTGQHRALMRGVLPNGAIIETPEVPFTLVCSGSAGELIDAGSRASDAGTKHGDASIAAAAYTGPLRGLDAGPSSTVDAGPAQSGVDAPVEGGSDEGGTADEGCSIASRHDRRGTLPWLMAAGLAGALWRRRRNTSGA